MCNFVCGTMPLSKALLHLHVSDDFLSGILGVVGKHLQVTISFLLSNRVLVLRPRGWGFEPHWWHCVVSLSRTHYSKLSTGSTQEDPSKSNQTKQNNIILKHFLES